MAKRRSQNYRRDIERFSDDDLFKAYRELREQSKKLLDKAKDISLMIDALESEMEIRQIRFFK